MLRRTLLTLTLLWLALSAAPARAAQPAVHAVLFYSPTCPHCHTVMTETLPPLLARYRGQLEIVAVDVTRPAGQALYEAMLQRYQVPPDRFGVPALVVGEHVLVGAIEIPELLPGIVDDGLAQGGLPWPDIPGLAERLAPQQTAAVPGTSTAAEPAVPPLLRDMPANAVAIVLLAGMVGVTAWALRAWRHPRSGSAPRWRDRAIPLVALAGLAVAGYLTLVETDRAAAVCGPLGNCDVVQQSPYAAIFGVPIGAIGLAGYAALLVAWGAEHLLRGRRAELAGLALVAMAGAGTLFSIYLTFLEPFVIGATCMWCLTSAALMTTLLWLVTPYRGLLVTRR